MSDSLTTDSYEIAGLPVDEIDSGRTVIVAGPTHGGARTAALRLLAGPSDEGVIVITTNERAPRVAEDCQRAGIALERENVAIIDCVGDAESGIPTRLFTVPDPSDLTGIGMRFSDVYSQFDIEGIVRVRTGLLSLSTLLTLGDLPRISRFVHTLTGRIDSVGGLGVLFVDPSNHDERAVNTVAQFCSGRIDVREGEAGPELRVGGLGGDRQWRPFEY